jgi:hypothetical protein
MIEALSQLKEIDSIRKPRSNGVTATVEGLVAHVPAVACVEVTRPIKRIATFDLAVVE